MTDGGAPGRFAARCTAGTIAVVLVILALVDAWVRGPFYARAIKPFHVDAFPVLADRTGGLQLNIFFDALSRAPRRGVRIAFVGDSTMNAFQYPERAYLPMRVLAAVRGRLGGVDVEMVDVSFIGLYSSDAALLVAKLLGDVDVIVYGLALRALPRHPASYWATSVSSELDVRTIARIAGAGGLRWLTRTVTSEQLATGLITTTWATYAYRTKLWNVVADRLTEIAPGLPLTRYTLGKTPPIAAPSEATSFDWPREMYGPPSASWDALDVIGGLCGRYAPGRCLLYAIPLNPDGRERLVEPALYQEFLTRARDAAARGRMTWLDLSDTMAPGDYRSPQFTTRGRDPIHLDREGLLKLAMMLADPVIAAARVAVAERGSARR